MPLTVEQVLANLDIPFRSEGHEHTRPGWVQTDCVWCSPDWQHWRLGINVSSLGVNCWSCGRHKLYDFLLEASGKPARVVLDAVRALRGGRDGFPVASPVREARGVLQTPKVGDFCLVHREYLERRGFDPDEVQRVWGVQGIAHCSDQQLQWRLFIPVVWRGEVVSWTTRCLVDREGVPRYFSAKPEQEVFRHKDLLYGEDLVRSSVACVEGPLDVWKIGPGATCTFGTSFTQAQVVKLAKYPTRVICFDKEPTAQRKARELCDALEVFPGRTINVVLETGKDPGECSPEELAELRELLQ